MARAVIVVDDDSGMRLMLKLLLGRKGYEVRAVPNASAALTLLETVCPQLFILDVMMPDGNGIDFCRELRHRPQTLHTPVIMFSAEDSLVTIKQCLAAGATQFVSKMDVQPHLLNAVHSLVSQTELRQEASASA